MSESDVKVFLRPVGSPVALGFFGLAAASFVLSGLQLGWVGPEQGAYVALVLIGFGFLGQLIAAVFGYLARDGVVATMMAVLALHWLVEGLVLGAAPPGTTSAALGLFLLVVAAMVAVSVVPIALSKIVPACVFFLEAVRLAGSGLYELTGSQGWHVAAGIVGVVLLLPAVYAALAAQIEEATGRTVLPFGRHGRGKSAMRGGLREQAERAPSDPGVRSQL